MRSQTPKEGDVYKVFHVGGHDFTIRYGFYSEADRCTEPIPIWPCFLTQPKRAPDGYPLITRIQDACEHYLVAQGQDGDGWCADCTHCQQIHEQLGICRCDSRRVMPEENKEERT